MTADFGRFVFYFSLWLCTLSLYGECRTDLRDGGYQLHKIDDDSKLTKPTAADAIHLSNNSLDEAISNAAAVAVPVANTRTASKNDGARDGGHSLTNADSRPDGTNASATASLAHSRSGVVQVGPSNPEAGTFSPKLDQPSTVRNHHSGLAKRAKALLSSDDRVDDGRSSDDIKSKLSVVKSRASKFREPEPAIAKDEAANVRSRRPQQRSVDDADIPSATAATAKQERPPSALSRGRLKFQLDNAITESTRPKAAPLPVAVGAAGGSRLAAVEQPPKLPLNGSVVGDADASDRTERNSTSGSTLPQAAVTAAGTADHERKRSHENATRSAKSSNLRYQHVGSDGYVFDHFDVDADTEKYKEAGGDDLQYDSRESAHPMGDPENNIDRIRNFNDNPGTVKVGNIVKKPQGFVLTTESHMEADIVRKTAISRLGASSGSAVSPMAPGTRKKIAGGSPTGEIAPATAGITRPGKGSSTENSPTSISKNEILRKPSVKPITSFTSRRRVSPPGVANDNSLPTTSAVWALAALKTPNNMKAPKRPIVEVAASPKPSLLPSTNIKPIVSWSTRLQKTTTEDLLDSTTTLRAPLEAEAETISPIALSGPKLMNVSYAVEMVPTVSSAETSSGGTFNRSNDLVDRPDSSVSNSGGNHVEMVRNETASTSVPASGAPVAVHEDIRVDLVDGKGNEEDEPISDTDKHVAVKDSVDDFTRFNYTTDGGPSVDVNETRVAILNDETDIAGDNENEIRVKIANNEAVVEHSSKSPVVTAESVNANVSVRVVNSEMAADGTASNSSVKLAVNASTPSNSVESFPVNDEGWSKEEQPWSSSSVTPSTSASENTESNVIFDQRNNNDRDKKNEVRVDSNHVESANDTNLKREPELPPQNETIEKVILPPAETLPQPKNISSAVVTEQNREVDAITEMSPPYEIDLDDQNEPDVPSSTNGTRASPPEFKEENATVDVRTPEKPDLFSHVIRNVSTSTASPHTVNLALSESVNDIVTSTAKGVHSKSHSTPASTSAATTTTTKMTTTTAKSTTTSNTASLPTHVTWSADDEDVSTDMLTTKIPASSTTSTTVKIVFNLTTPTKGKHGESTAASDEFVYLTTVSNIQKAFFTTSRTDPAVVYSSSQKPSTSTTTTTTTTTSASVNSEEIPLVTPFKPNLPPENVPGYLMLFFKTSFADICQTSSALRENLFQFITQRSLRVQSKDQVVMVIDPEQCKEPADHSLRLIPVALYLVDDFGSYDKTLIDEMKKLLEDDNLNNYTLPIHEIVYHENIIPDNSRVIAAIIITSIAAVCFVLLIFLMCTIRNRQKLNYGQRCTPVSVDDYNLDNISDYNSIRRKGIMRASKRSYGNPAFDDPLGPSKSLTYNGLLKACENRCTLDEEFTQIPVVTVKPDELPLGAEMKNRYANVIPLPETRVSLSSNNNCSDSIHDYINANYVKGFKEADKFYIACQAPLQNTIEDFWKMVWKEQTKVIIMLTGLSENGVEKCADYLPPSEVLDCHRLFGDYQVTLKKREVKEKYVISCLQLKNMENNLWREVTHLWYTNWPAQGVPNEQSSIIALLIEARAYMRNTTGPHVVHCSPGTGRTGTVIAIDICIRDYELSRSVNIPATVAKLRRCRAGAVMTKEQYAFIYKVLALYARKLNGGAPLDSM